MAGQAIKTPSRQNKAKQIIRSERRRQFADVRPQGHSSNGLGGGLGVNIAKGGPRPFYADFGGWPDSEQRAALWEGEPDPIEEAWMRRMYDVNRELIEDLGPLGTRPWEYALACLPLAYFPSEEQVSKRRPEGRLLSA